MNFLKNKKLSIDLYLLTILIAFFVSRLYIHCILNIEFTYYFKDYLIQYLDLATLRNDLWQSIFYLHSQPPLFNLAIGLSEIILGSYSSLMFLFLFQLMGLLTAILGFRILETLRIKKSLAVILMVTYLLAPATLLYENLFFYTHAIIFFLAMSAYYFLKFLNESKPKDSFLFFSGISITILITSFFHIIWFIIVFLFLLFVKDSNRKVVIRSAFLPLIIILALYLKNFLVFDFFGSSSWIGMNLSRITAHQMVQNQKEVLIKKGDLSQLSSIAPFTHYKDMDSKFVEKYFSNHSGIGVLDKLEKINGRTNYNNAGYIAISNQLLKDDLFIIKNYPQVYLAGILKAFTLYFDSPTKYKLISANAYKIKTYNKIYNAFIYGSSSHTKTGYITILLITIIIFSSIYLVTSSKSNFFTKIFITYALINIFYVMFVGNLFEYGENNRFRYYTEIFYFLLLCISVNELIIKPISLKNKNNL